MAFTFPAGFPRPFGPYLLLSSFGRGGMGEVFLAKRHQIAGVDELCIVKTVRQDLSSEESYSRRFLDEARLVVHLSHANICPVFDVGQVASEYFMTMEYIAGANLKDVLARVAKDMSTVPTAVALHIGCEMLHALGYAHRRTHPVTGQPLKLVHRDVSPHNVMVGFDGAVKLIDFGLAESALKEEHTESHVVLGKLAYMAPEQARGVDVDARCDQFAAAVLLYEMLAGDRYYGTMNQREIWEIAGRGAFTPERWGALDVELQRILSRALESDPERRYESCDAFRAELDAYRYAAGQAARLEDVQGFLRRHCQDTLVWEQEMRAACTHLQAPDPHARGPSDDDVTLILWRDEMTGSIAWRDEAGGIQSLPLSAAAKTERAARLTPLAPAKSRRPLALAAAATSVVVLAGAAFLWQSFEAPLDDDAVAVQALPPPVPMLVQVQEAPQQEPQRQEQPQLTAPAAGNAVALRAGAEDEEIVVEQAPAKGKRRAARRDARRKQPKAAIEAKAEPSVEPREAEPAEVPKPPRETVAPVKRSLAESLRILKGCSNRCADDARAVARTLEEREFKGAKRGIIDFCVDRCVDDG